MGSKWASIRLVPHRAIDIRRRFGYIESRNGKTRSAASLRISTHPPTAARHGFVQKLQALLSFIANRIHRVRCLPLAVKAVLCGGVFLVVSTPLVLAFHAEALDTALRYCAGLFDARPASGGIRFNALRAALPASKLSRLLQRNKSVSALPPKQDSASGDAVFERQLAALPDTFSAMRLPEPGTWREKKIMHAALAGIGGIGGVGGGSVSLYSLSRSASRSRLKPVAASASLSTDTGSSLAERTDSSLAEPLIPLSERPVSEEIRADSVDDVPNNSVGKAASGDTLTGSAATVTADGNPNSPSDNAEDEPDDIDLSPARLVEFELQHARISRAFHEPEFLVRQVGLIPKLRLALSGFDEFAGAQTADDFALLTGSYYRLSINPFADDRDSTQSDSTQSDSTKSDSTNRLQLLNLDSLRTDSLLVPLDSISVQTKFYATPYDSLLETPVDSADRLKAFRYKLKESPAVPLFESVISPLFLPRSSTVRSVVLDSVGENIIITEKLDGYDVRTPLKIPFALYKDLRYKQIFKRNFRDKVIQRSALAADPLQTLFGKLTKITVTIPGGEGGLFSTLFGPPTVSLQVSGTIDIKAAFQNQSSTDPRLTLQGAATTNDPVFDQQVSMNVTGTIGDKLTILADWNTQRQFDFENQLKLRYRGYEDEIIQNIEAGNVGLQLPTSLIGSNQALFGVKADFQIAGLKLTAIASQKRGKSETIAITGGAQEQTVTLRAWEYEAYRHFFISNFYAFNWERSFDRNSPQIVGFTDPEGRVLDPTQTEVWMTLPASQQNATEFRDGVALLYLGDTPYTQSVLPPTPSQFFPDPNQTAGFTPQELDSLRRAAKPDVLFSQIDADSVGGTKQGVRGKFIKLAAGVDYTINRTLGFITVLRNFDPQNDAIAISYRYTGAGLPDRFIGDRSIGQTVNATDRLILKLVKPRNLVSGNRAAWLLMLKNIYSLKAGGVKAEGFKLTVTYEQLGGSPPEIITLPDGVQVRVPKPGAPPFSRNLLNIVGLDRFNPQGAPQEDNLFDYIPNITVDEQYGRIIFPYLRPFSDRIDSTIDSSLAVPPATPATAADLIYNEVYDNEIIGAGAASSIGQKNKYLIRASFKSDVRSDYNLGFNVVPGSVRISSSSGQLTEGVDFTVDYQLGQVTIIKQSALQPGANLRIEFEKNELAIIAAKTLLGARAEYTFSDNFKLGGTFLEYNERPLSDKVRVGDEPILNRIYGFDLRYKAPSLRWLTKLIDALPFISTKEESELAFNAEFAQVLPSHPGELNTAIDPNGVSYIDDFEGTKQVFTLGLLSNQWFVASPPDSVPGRRGNTLTDDSLKSNRRSQLSWFNYIDQDAGLRLPISQIFPNRNTTSTQGTTINTLNLAFFPHRRGIYNYTRNLRSDIFSQPDSTWGGLMKQLPTYVSNFQKANVEFIEFWVKYERGDPNTFGRDRFNSAVTSDSGYINIDLGSISEDVLPDGDISSEDGLPLTSAELSDPTIYRNGTYGRVPLLALRANNQLNSSELDEDVGIDGVGDVDELRDDYFGRYVQAIRDSAAANPTDAQLQDELSRVQQDPSGDTYAAPRNNLGDYFRYVRVNGSEKNRDLNSIYPDTEVLNGQSTTGSSERGNRYYQYRVKVSDEIFKAAIPSGEFVVGGGQSNGGWVQYRIPVRSFYARTGSITDFTNIRNVRIWVSGFKSGALVRFATLDFIGSQWLRPSKEVSPNVFAQDSTVSLAVINLEENAPLYGIPPGIQRARNRAQQTTDQTVLQNEQAIVVRTGKMAPQEYKAAYRDLTVQQLNLNPYRRLKMFLHANKKSENTEIIYERDGASLKRFNAYAFIRFGVDSTSNYYEYRVPLVPSDSGIIIPPESDPNNERERRRLWPFENEINLDLQQLSVLKQQIYKDTVLYGKARRIVVDSITTDPSAPEGNRVIVVGSPSLGTVRFLMVGVLNVSGEPLAAEIWANELRATDYREEPGWAAKADISLKLADLATVNASVQRTTADFHGIDVRLNQLAGQNNSFNWAVGTSITLDKFLPAEAGWNLPVAYDHTESVSEPKYSPTQTDIEISALITQAVADTLQKLQSAGVADADAIAKAYGETLRNTARSVTVTNRISTVGWRKRNPSESWLMQLTLDRISAGFNYTVTESRSPSVEFAQSWQWQGNLEYTYTLPQRLYVEPLKFLAGIPVLKDYKDLKLFYVPQSVSTGVAISRTRAVTLNRGVVSAPYSGSFTASRSFAFGYQITETFDLRYTASLGSSLNTLTLNEQGQELRGGAVFNRVLENLSRLKLGNPNSFQQTITISWRPKLIEYLNWMRVNSIDYNTSYGWQNPQPDVINTFGNSTSNTNSFRVGVTLQPKMLFDKFGLKKDADWVLGGGTQASPAPVQPPPPPKRLAAPIDTTLPPEERLRLMREDSLSAALEDSLAVARIDTVQGPSPLATLGKDAKNVFLTLFNFGDVSLNFSTGNSLQNSAVGGSIGWFNFFPFNQLGGAREFEPPGFGYQLGFAGSPGGRIFNNVNGTQIIPADAFTQTNTFDASTSLELASNFRINLSWRTNWNYSRRENLNSDGSKSLNGVSGGVTKSFILLFRNFDNFRDALPLNEDGTRATDNITLADAFERGLEPTGLTRFTGRALRMSPEDALILPLPNWQITWTGLEKFLFFNGLASTVSIEHAYTSGYTSQYTVNANGNRENNAASVTEQLAPLAGLNVAWLFGLNSSLRYNRSRGLTLNFSNKIVDRQESSEIAVSLGFQKSGLKIPLNFWPFNGSTLENNLDVSFTLAIADEERQQLQIGESSIPAVGTTRTTFEPRIRYDLSSRVNASFFWRYSNIKPKGSGGSVFESTKNEIGFNFRILISG